ncbi:MAG: HAD-IIA family hydrolase [Oscillospiraceae bacterium]|nr:HAD-IIA family hydrolase [Oscillospiraceae bacterium]
MTVPSPSDLPARPSEPARPEPNPPRQTPRPGVPLAQLIKETRLFVVDMDGTIYLGENPLPGAWAFLQACQASAERDCLFFTNNSSTTAAHYAQKLRRLGWQGPLPPIVTSGDVAISWLQREQPQARVCLLATPSVTRQFEAAGIRLWSEPAGPDDSRAERPDLVLLTFDQSLTYAKLARACQAIREGAGFVATHPDINCPTENGFIPDCGAIISLISASTGVKPVILGKPYPETVAAIEALSGVPRSQLTFIGDRLYTDIACGVNNGAHGLLVLSGEASRADLAGSPVQPDAVLPSVADLVPWLSQAAAGAQLQR